MHTASYDEAIKGLHEVFHDYRRLLCWPVASVKVSHPQFGVYRASQFVTALLRVSDVQRRSHCCLLASDAVLTHNVPESLHKYGEDRKLILTAPQLGRCFWNSSEKGWTGVALRREILQAWNPSCTQLPVGAAQRLIKVKRLLDCCVSDQVEYRRTESVRSLAVFVWTCG